LSNKKNTKRKKDAIFHSFYLANRNYNLFNYG